MDLYRDATRVPFLLEDGRVPVSYDGWRATGISKRATYWAAGRGRIQRPQHGLYLPGAEPPTVLEKVRSALAVAPPEAVVGFHTAALLYGFGVVEEDRVHLMVPAGNAFPQRRGIASHQVTLPIGDPVTIFGVPCAPASRVAVDLARLTPRAEALPIVDAALFAGACSVEQLRDEVRLHDGLRGVRQAREIVGIADGRAECRQESELRLLFHDLGIEGFQPQLTVFDYRMDLGNPELRIGVEYDGASHLDRSRLRADRWRHNRLSDRGWAMRYATAHDLYRAPAPFVTSLLRLIARRRSRAKSRDW
ncbi:hypothetical protein [Catenuloplanes atrovinosus]|uniref:Very-short-patch-repair endonuclease n=1 Tax=Catenuloplanes atrovinosus TaxID=137266 RepID=A0AAE3YWF1_9ACTN|nr:hypothetical protein [Catenuloplanes atrovinosus]MDR7279850.1 very-short-patch-repair endonuclease [Catenuloplanes atrovinosus]